MNKPLILLAFLSVTFIYVINLWFSASGFYLFFTSFFLLSGLIFLPKIFKVSTLINYQTGLVFTLILFTILSFSLVAYDVNGQLSLAMWINRFLMFSATLISIFYTLKTPKTKLFKFIFAHKFSLLILCAFFIQLTLLRVVKVPDVDIYNIVKYGPLQLLAGQNPYVTPDPHFQIYTYGPASLFLFLPFDWLLGDPRYLLIISNFFVAYALYKISRGSEVLALIYLFHPRYPNLLVNSVTDVVIVGLLAWGLLSLHTKKFIQAGSALALLVGIKLLYAIPLLFLLKSKIFLNKRLILSGIIVLGGVYIPFLFSDSKAIIDSTLLFHLKASGYNQFLPNAVVTLAAFINRQWSYHFPSIVFPIVNVIFIGLMWLAIKPTRSMSRICLIICFIFVTSLFLSHLALPGYYFVASSFLLFALAFAHSAKNEKTLLASPKKLKL